MKRRLSIVMAVGLLLMVAVAVAAASYVSGGYSGHTSQGSPGHRVAITFTVVKPAHAQAYVTNIFYRTIDKCSRGTVSVTHTRTGALGISRGGSFTDSHAYGSTGRNHVKLTGHIQGNKASGTITDDNVSPPPVCHGKASWSARH